MHTVLGANGTIGHQLSLHLPNYYDGPVRQVSRHPKKVNATDELVSADLLRYDLTEQAIAGSSVVYLLAGLKYDTNVWRDQWPKVMRHVIDACKKHQSKLVFFDNVYAYGKVIGKMTEEAPFNPCSKKGELRAQIATLLLEEIQKKNLEGMIVRAADFYGPGALLSMTHSTVTERLKNNKGAQWIGNPKNIHTFSYTPDAGRTVAILANTPVAYGQTWHALTSKELITGEQYVKIASEVLGLTPKKIQAMSKLGVRALGLFIPVLREFVEMMYQFEADYVFDSSKVEKAFQLTATKYQKGIAETMKYTGS